MKDKLKGFVYLLGALGAMATIVIGITIFISWL